MADYWERMFKWMPKENTRDNLLMAIFVFLAVAVTFTIVLLGEYSFLYVSLVMVVLITIYAFIHKEIHLTIFIFAGIILSGIMHLAGEFVYLDGIRLYDLYFFWGFIKYDNFTHLIGAFIVTFVAYNMLKPHLDHNMKYNRFFFCFILVLITMGFGVVGEIFEFGATIFLGIHERVGGYVNNAIDLIFNFVGAALACLIIHPYHKQQRGKASGYKKPKWRN